MAERTCLRIFQLVIKDEVVATRIGFVLGNELWLYYSGHDPRWMPYSVMTTTVTEIIKWAIEHGFGLVNLATGTDVSKTRWRPTELKFSDGVQVAPTLPARIVFELVYKAWPKVHASQTMRKVLAAMLRPTKI
jgi:CelD/BcsL family acetyltransferase involved in cellulose biosynthesis